MDRTPPIFNWLSMSFRFINVFDPGDLCGNRNFLRLDLQSLTCIMHKLGSQQIPIPEVFCLTSSYQAPSSSR